tara:strand:- start:620 stop:946 length:327 start_codon:yes stop_codon:yes gene_type:complete
MNKKINIFLLLLILFLQSCGSWDEVKKGITGQKTSSTDEFLVEKKDPLVKPPNFEELPVPGSNTGNVESSEDDTELQSLTSLESEEEVYEAAETGSTESNILKRIKKK